MTVATISCEGAEHTIRYGGELVLLGHPDLERDLAFQALRTERPEGCLAVLEAWHSVRRAEASKELLQALLLDDEDIRQWVKKQWQNHIFFAPQLTAALEGAGVKAGSHTQRCRWNLLLLDLPQPMRLAYCRSLGPELADLSDEELQFALIGETPLGQVLPFERRVGRRSGR